MDLRLSDRVFVVTAASGGLGRATAAQWVAEGAKVVLVARRGNVLAEAVAEFGPGKAVSLTADLSDASTAADACRLALDTFGRLDGALISVGGPTGRDRGLHQRRAVAGRLPLRVPGRTTGVPRSGDAGHW